eukprot:TRINITY_DN2865_c0_g2_i1.p2 TRINITY_DN2865_c0_g2~~TRINITY_DN2865_c0_g2_i1.p2  ORF type:complete len:147 (-),score=11.00 TRINITY_DN2865_c0_g2_i1:177-617(-)
MTPPRSSLVARTAMKIAAFLLFGGAALVDGFLTGPATFTALAPGRLPMTRPSTSSSVRTSGSRGGGFKTLPAHGWGGPDTRVQDRLRTIEDSVGKLLSEFADFKSKLDVIDGKVSIVSSSWSNTVVGVLLGAAITTIMMTVMDGPI